MARRSIEVPAAFYAYVSAERRSDESMADALLRLVGGPHPDAVAGAVSEDAAEAVHEAVERRGDRAEGGRASVARSFSASGDR